MTSCSWIRADAPSSQVQWSDRKSSFGHGYFMTQHGVSDGRYSHAMSKVRRPRAVMCTFCTSPNQRPSSTKLREAIGFHLVPESSPSRGVEITSPTWTLLAISGILVAVDAAIPSSVAAGKDGSDMFASSPAKRNILPMTMCPKHSMMYGVTMVGYSSSPLSPRTIPPTGTNGIGSTGYSSKYMASRKRVSDAPLSPSTPLASFQMNFRLAMTDVRKSWEGCWTSHLFRADSPWVLTIHWKNSSRKSPIWTSRFLPIEAAKSAMCLARFATHKKDRRSACTRRPVW